MMHRTHKPLAAMTALWLVAIWSCCVMRPARADDSVELATKLANPIANLISVPIKLDWDTGIGSNDADQYNFVIQPVIPFSLNSDWSLISRTIAPFIEAKAAQPGLSDESGLGDITQSFFFSPKAPTAAGWIWGAGPVLLLPTATNDRLGGENAVRHGLRNDVLGVRGQRRGRCPLRLGRIGAFEVVLVGHFWSSMFGSCGWLGSRRESEPSSAT